MTKKHFIALADHLRLEWEGKLGAYVTKHPNPSAAVVSHLIVESLADFCQSQNARFDRERWLGYIRGTNGPNGGPRKA